MLKLSSLVFGIICALLLQRNEASDLKLPSNVDQRLYCMGCIATVKELDKILTKRRVTSKNRESKVMEATENICSPENFVEYEYSPPKTSTACKLLMENHEEDIENAFTKNKNNKEKLICYELSKACNGIDTAEKKPSENSQLNLSGGKEGESISQSVKIDPNTGKAEAIPDTKKATSGKTMSKSDRKKKAAKPKKTKKEEKKKPAKQQQGGLNQMNIDINDPDAMEKVMAQIKEATKQHKSNKEEL